MQTVSVGAVQASLFVSATDENETRISEANENTRSTLKYADVTLTLDENPGIFAFAYHLDFDASAWQAVSVTLAPNAAQRGIFMPTLPPLDGGSNPGRLTFLGFIDDWNDPDTTGIIATVRFEGISANPDVSSFVLGDLEVVGESMNVSSLARNNNMNTSSLAGGSDSPSLHNATRLHRYMAGLPGHDISPMCTALDMNNDGRINMRDLLLMSQKFVGYDIASGLCAESLNLVPKDDVDNKTALGSQNKNKSSSGMNPRSGTSFVTKPKISGGYGHVIALKSDGTVWTCA